MKELLVKDNLGKFPKSDLVSFFPSLKLESGMKKPDMIKAIMDGEPTEGEMNSFAKQLEAKNESISEAKIKLPRADAKLWGDPRPLPEINPNDKFIVKHTIKENGKVFEPGDEYTGKKAARYVRDGQIRVKD